MIHVSPLNGLRDVAARLGSFDMLTMLSPGSAVGATDGLTPPDTYIWPSTTLSKRSPTS